MLESMSVNPAQVIALSGQIRTGATGINGHLETLETQVSKLRAQWSGEAQEAYDVAQRDWNVKLKELQQLLTQIATKTQEMSEEYTARDKGSRQRFLA